MAVPACACVCVGLCARRALAPAPLPSPSSPPPLSPALREGGVAGVEGGPAPKWGGASPLRSAGGEDGGAWWRQGCAWEEYAAQSGPGALQPLVRWLRRVVRAREWARVDGSVRARVFLHVVVCSSVCARAGVRVRERAPEECRRSCVSAPSPLSSSPWRSARAEWLEWREGGPQNGAVPPLAVLCLFEILTV